MFFLGACTHHYMHTHMKDVVVWGTGNPQPTRIVVDNGILGFHIKLAKAFDPSSFTDELQKH